jgi:phosphate:Na+ symporter
VELISPGTILPGLAGDPAIPVHLAMFHTIFNVMNTILFFPFVKPFAALVSFLAKDDQAAAVPEHYRLAYQYASIQDTPELNILRAEKEIRDMAGIASSMYGRVSGVLRVLKETADKEGTVNSLIEEMRKKEEYADEMREVLTAFLIECTREQLHHRSERWISQLLRIIADLEDMTDDCLSVSLILERSVKKNHIFKGKEMSALVPYVNLVEEFLTLVREHLGRRLSPEEAKYAAALEEKIDTFRNKLRKLGRKRIEAGVDVKTELLFIDLVRRIEKLGDYCFNIAEILSRHAA